MRIALIAALLTLLAFPASGLAGSVAAVQDTVIVSEHAYDEANDIEVNVGSDNDLHFTAIEKRTGLTMFSGDGCVSKSSTTAVCDVLFDTGIAALHGGDDTFHNNTFVPFTILGKAGADKLFGGNDVDTVAGGLGNDESHGGEGDDLLLDEAGQGDLASGNDKMFGDGGNDTMVAGMRGAQNNDGAGADSFDGGSGIDTVDYSMRTTPQSISEDALANDGIPGGGLLGEHDNVISAEILVGGSAGDTITGGAAPNTLRGGDGNDDLHGGFGFDTLRGEEGDDVLDGGLDTDLLVGGHGRDTASYADRIQPVVASLDGAANDGAGAENERIDDDVENLAGGFVGDDLIGSGGPNLLHGNEGPDKLRGAGGDDLVEGDGDDDDLNGDSGDDAVNGGGGNDTVAGGSGNDALAGGVGDDTIAARDASKDLIGCGAGVDSVAADPFDTVAADCEKVSRGTGALSLPRTIRVTPKRVATVRVGCPAKAFGGCRRGTLTLLAKGTKVATAAFTIGAGDSAKVQLRLSAKGLTALRNRKPRTLRATSPGAAAAVEAVTVKLPPAP